VEARERALGSGTFAKTPNPVALRQPGVGHSRIESAPGGATTNERQSRQKKFARPWT